MNLRTLAAASPAGRYPAVAGQRLRKRRPPTLQERFEKKVQEYEAADHAAPPPRGAILFAGDSQFYRWNTIHEDLPGYTLINRGIDSFQTADLIRYADRLVTALPAAPHRAARGRQRRPQRQARPRRCWRISRLWSPRCAPNYRACAFVYSSITPGPGRWDEAPQRRETNRVIQEYIATQPDLGFIDLWDAMLTPDGQPREDIWVADRVHPNHAGYLIRVKLTQPFLGKPDR